MENHHGGERLGGGVWRLHLTRPAILSATQLSGGYSPASLFAGGEQGLIIDPSALGAFYQDSAGTTSAAIDAPVGKANDLSPNANHLTQATAAARPMMRQASGLNYLDADGVDDYLASVAAGLRITGALTILAAVRRDTGSRFDMWATCQTNAATVNQYEFRTGNTANTAALQFIGADAALEQDNSNLVVAPLAENTLLGVRRTGTQAVFEVGGVTQALAHTKVPTSDASSEFRLFSRKGSALFADGRIYFALVIARALTDSEMIPLRTYAGAKAGLVL